VKKLFFLILAVALVTAGAYGQSAKNAIAGTNINIVGDSGGAAVVLGYTGKTPVTNGDWNTILKTGLHTSQQKDLLMGVSLECALYTDTTVTSKNMTSDTSTAAAGVEIQVLVDNTLAVAYPKTVTFCRRTQTLTATLEGAIANCLSVDPVSGGIILDPTCVQPEVIGLTLDTMGAHHYNFALENVGVGYHNITVQARLTWNTSVQTGSARALAALGAGIVTVEEVRLVKAASGTYLQF
jgi:hypothetical protein